MPIALSIIGPQGSGKSTQLEILRALGYAAIDMSQVLSPSGFIAWTMSWITRFSEKGRKHARIKRCMKKGLLVPDEDVLQILEEYLSKIPAGKNLVFVGMPRNATQAQYLEALLRKRGVTLYYVILEMPEDVARERIAKRVEEMRAKGEEPREDDLDPETVSRRLRKYYENLALIKKHIASTNTSFGSIDALLSKKEVARRISEFIRPFSLAA
ncbi:MAG: nucleoside monophosphate kinase [Candidatus Paceibacterota bacterium]|jgi:adenylate kinase